MGSQPQNTEFRNNPENVQVRITTKGHSQQNVINRLAKQFCI